MTPFYRFIWSTVRILARLIFRLKAINEENIPAAGPFILACNHISLTDPPFVAVSVKRPIHFMAKKELFKNRLFGRLITALNSHPIQRGFDRQAIDTAVDILKEGNGILIFPEGTRAKHGDFLTPKPGIGIVALKSKAPIVPVYINGSNKRMACFLGREKLAVVFGRPIEWGEISRHEDNKEGYRAVAEMVMSRIKKLKKDFSDRSLRA